MKYLLIFLMVCSVCVAADLKLEPIKGSVRDDYIHIAQVWHPTDVPHMDIFAGPQNEISVPAESVVNCTYVEGKSAGGTVPKFKCKLQSGETVRVKFGKENREIYSEVAGTRLLWALGFYTDEDYPVQIRCLRCPDNPFNPKKHGRRTTRLIRYAIMERNFPGVIIEESEDQGWKWKELDKIDEKMGGANLAQIDALRLLAVFLQHADNKPQQQRLGCYAEDIRDPDGDGVGTCVKPVMMIQDLGAEFGAGVQFINDDAKMNFEGWKSKEIWNRKKEADFLEKNKQPACFGDLTNSISAGDEGLQDPPISEAGRKFLAGLLNQLSQKQIENLFRVARADQVPYEIEVDGVKRTPNIMDWTAVFLKKRDEINKHECP